MRAYLKAFALVMSTKSTRVYRRKEVREEEEEAEAPEQRVPPQRSGVDSSAVHDEAYEREQRRKQREIERAENTFMAAVGEVVRGRVTSVKDFGLFLRLAGSGREGLCHVSEVSAQRTSSQALREQFPVDTELSVKVLSVGEGPNGKISLSLKQAGLYEVHAPACALTLMHPCMRICLYVCMYVCMYVCRC